MYWFARLTLTLAVCAAATTSLFAQPLFGDVVEILPQSWGSYYGFSAADLNGDDAPDIVGSEWGSGEIKWYPNDGAGGFDGYEILADSVGYVFYLETGDFDGDDDVDVVASLRSFNGVYWFANDGAGNFSERKLVLDSVSSLQYIKVVDFDDDDDLDLLVCDYELDMVALLLNDGTGDFSDTTMVATFEDGALCVDAGDLDGDGDLDVAYGASKADRFRWRENLGDGTFGPANQFPGVFAETIRIVVADIDQDGDEDVLAADYLGNIGWFENDSGGVFSEMIVVEDEAKSTRGLAARDIDGDGDLDVVHAGQGNETFSVTDTFSVGWHENLGGGEIDTAVNVVFNNKNNYIHALVVVDIDVDGDLDLLFDIAENGYMGYHPNTRITSTPTKLETPAAFTLSQNYPNPFNPATTIRYALPEAATVRLTVFNALGQAVRELESSAKQPGYHETSFNASDLGSGVYFYRIDAVGSSGERFQETRKMLLVK